MYATPAVQALTPLQSTPPDGEEPGGVVVLPADEVDGDVVEDGADVGSGFGTRIESGGDANDSNDGRNW